MDDTEAVMAEAVRLLDIFVEGCSNTRPFGKKAWCCAACYADIVQRLLAAGVPDRRLAEAMVMAHRYPARARMLPGVSESHEGDGG